MHRTRADKHCYCLLNHNDDDGDYDYDDGGGDDGCGGGDDDDGDDYGDDGDEDESSGNGDDFQPFLQHLIQRHLWFDPVLGIRIPGHPITQKNTYCDKTIYCGTTFLSIHMRRQYNHQIKTKP